MNKIRNKGFLQGKGDRLVAPACLEDMIFQQDNLVEDDSEE
jgi:hypothetical protein